MISGSTIAAVNVPDSKNTLSRHLHQKRREKARRKKLAREQQKIPPPLRPQISEPTANQAFHDASSKIVPHSQLQNKVATLELQVLEAKKAALQKQLQNLTTANPALSVKRPAANLEKARNENFGSFYEHKGEESHLVLLIRKYQSVDILHSRYHEE